MCLFERIDNIGVSSVLEHLDEDELKNYKRIREILLSRLDPVATGKEKVANIFSLVDELIAEFLEKNKITCHRGCSTCCHQLVWCTTLEMELIVWHLEFLPRESKRSIVQRVNKEARWLDKFVRKLYSGSLPSRWELLVEPLSAAYSGKRQCSFLNSTSACSIYPVRPIDCRIARSQDSRCGSRINTPEVKPGEVVVEVVKDLVFFFDQVASDLLMEEEEEVYGAMQLVPLPAWALTPTFYNFFTNKQSQPKQKKKRTRLRPSISSGLRRGKGKHKRK